MDVFVNWVVEILNTPKVEPAVILVILILGAGLGHIVAGYILGSRMSAVLQNRQSRWMQLFATHRVPARVSQFAPACILYIGANYFEGSLKILISRAAMVYIIAAGVWTIQAVLSVFLDYCKPLLKDQQVALESSVQAVRVLIGFSGIILSLSVVLQKSPTIFLSGLTAMAALLLLVFKDPLLGFVASIQLSTNDLVRSGDWIELPDMGVDGNVEAVTLTNITVKNWDNTLSILPTYSLISGPFKNWRGMSDSGARRIKRAIYIDMKSIGFCSQDEIKSYQSIAVLAPSLAEKCKDVEAHNQATPSAEAVGAIDCSKINQRNLTNIGVYRMYCEAYLKQLPTLNTSFTTMVRQKDPTAKGLPLEVYAFTNTTNWTEYEGIQSDIFDHLLSVLPLFGLRVFQYSNGDEVYSNEA